MSNSGPESQIDIGQLFITWGNVAVHHGTMEPHLLTELQIKATDIFGKQAVVRSTSSEPAIIRRQADSQTVLQEVEGVFTAYRLGVSRLPTLIMNELVDIGMSTVTVQPVNLRGEPLVTIELRS